MEYYGGILWPETSSLVTVKKYCRSVDADYFRRGSFITRYCYKGKWMPPDYSGCRLKEEFNLLFIWITLSSYNNTLLDRNLFINEVIAKYIIIHVL